MKKILNTLSEKWPEYLIEGLVIIVSILVAIELENWNENRQNEEKEVKYLTAIVSDLDRDIDDLIWNEDFTRGKLEANNRVLAWVRESQPIYDSFSYDLANLLTPVHFLSNTSGYVAVQNAGIEIIRDDSIRTAIVYLYDWYEKHLQYFEENDDHVVQYHLLSPVYNKHVKVHRFWERAEAVDLNGIRKSTEFYNLLTTNQFYREYMLAEYRDAAKRAKSLRRAIKNYLQQL